MLNRFRSFVLLTIGLVLVQVSPGPAMAEKSFAGKTIHIVVNFAAGGPADGFIRHFAPHLSSRIPGKPTIVVENRTGAAGRVGANYIYNLAPPDGTVIGFLVALASQDIIGGAGVRFDAGKFRWLGAVPQTQVLLSHKSLGVSTVANLAKAGKQIVYGATGRNSINGLNSRLFLDLLGIGYKHVTGYRGQAGALQALRRGEINLTDAGISIYLPNRESWKREGLFVPIAQRGVLQLDGTFQRTSAIPDLQTMPEVIAALRPDQMNSPAYKAFRALVGTYGVQFPLVLPPKADDETVAVLTKAVAETFGDPQVKESAAKRFKFAYDFVDGAQSQAFVQKLFADYRSDPRVAEVVQELLKQK